jgi:hypothetical protein
MKSLLINVTCSNKDIDDLPQYFHLSITPELKSRVLYLNNILVQSSSFSINDLCSDGDYFDLELEESLSPGKLNYASITPLLKNHPVSSTDLEAYMLCVTSHHFMFLAQPKHYESDAMVRTSEVPISFLTNSEPLFHDIPIYHAIKSDDMKSYSSSID